MSHYKLLFPNEYVGAWDLEKEKMVTIESILIDKLQSSDGRSEKKPVLHFKGKSKKLVLNKTNAAIIAELYGTDTNNWIGKDIILYATECQAFGKKVECVRVREIKP